MGRAELLAPAGSEECLIAAVQNGADAVYFGTGGFNARANAANFIGDEAGKAIDYCHERGVKAYLTLNTLILDREVDAALETARQLYAYGADAFIVQDMGFISILRAQMGDIPIHGSTQMTIHNATGVQIAQKMGLQRVVLSRETSLEDIRHIKETVSGIALETFVHGAMCVSVSGQCLLSSFIGERSGNRGACAQPCRLPYEMDDARSFLLSMKDLCMIEHIEQLREAGVESFKIEGRMKRPEYVAVVTRSYRKAIDGEITDMNAELTALKKIFDRGEFSTGYYFGRDGQVDTSRSGNIGIEADKEQLKQAQESYRGENRRTPVDAFLKARAEMPAELTLSFKGQSVTVMGECTQIAGNAPLSEQKVHDALSKLGGTPYQLNRLKTCFEDKTGTPAGIFLPVSALNDLRRQAVVALSKQIIEQYHRTMPMPAELELQDTNKQDALPLICARVTTVGQAEAALAAGADEIQACVRQWNETTIKQWNGFVKTATKPVYIVLPPVLMTGEFEYVCNLLKQTEFIGAIAGNIGQIDPLKELFSIVRGDYTLNILNSFSAKAHCDLGLRSVALSVELTTRQIRDIIKRVNGDIVLYGQLPMMNLLHCPIRRVNKACAKDCAAGRILKDRKGYEFALLPLSIGVNRCNVQLLNSVPLDGLKFMGELKGVGARSYLLLFFKESLEQVKERVEAYKAALSGGVAFSLERATGGHLGRGVK